MAADHRPQHARQGLHLRGAAAGRAARKDGVIDAEARTILMADDDADDCLLVREALGRAAAATTCGWCATARSCWTICYRRGDYAAAGAAPRARPDPARSEDAQEGRPRGACGS